MAFTNQGNGSSAGGGGSIRFSEGALLTPSAGVITPTDPFHHVAAGTISSIATTNFDTNSINFLLLEADGAVTLTSGASLKTKTTTLADDDVILLKLEGTIWSEVATASLTGTTLNLSNITLTGTTAQFNTALSDGDFATLAGTETLTNKTLTAPSATTLNVTDNNLQMNAAQFQAFEVEINNNAGTLRHRIIADFNNAVLPTLSNKVTGASASYNNTPEVASGVAFTAGFGVDDLATSIAYFNTAAQTQATALFNATLVYNDTGTALTVEPLTFSRNVNGTTLRRAGFQIRNATSGAAVNINTTDIAAGKTIIVRMSGFIA